MNNKKLTHLLVTSVLSSALILSAGTGSAFANGEETVANNAAEEEISVTEQTEMDSTEENMETVPSEGTEEGTEESSEENFDTVDLAEVSLIPGDFFYFVKTITEKIHLAITFDDYKEAELLAEFASERIAEANALIAEGKMADAEELLQVAISLQELAGEKLPESETDSDENTEAAEEPEGATEETEAAPAENGAESKLAHNIDSVLAVLEKVENPQAQQAILKNIQKSFEKMEKKFMKLEEADAKFAEKLAEIEAKLASGQISTEEADREKAKLEEELEKKAAKIEEEEERDVEEINNEVAKAAAEAANEEKRAEQESVKKTEEQQREAAKKAEEQQREAAKKAEEQQREAAKKAEEQQREAAKKAEGKE
ncbi:DUF5667 domain-containing protein [Bacillus sp. J33]|uniref:DUF5667 domain-containing protein n=1 Tax=Bacillus sp. J33 TaxID=935836 RepID=UPI00047C5E2D|nr:DUF5667 domain-containing protein [Bacillus sp. J33]